MVFTSEKSRLIVIIKVRIGICITLTATHPYYYWDDGYYYNKCGFLSLQDWLQFEEPTIVFLKIVGQNFTIGLVLELEAISFFQYVVEKWMSRRKSRKEKNLRHEVELKDGHDLCITPWVFCFCFFFFVSFFVIVSFFFFNLIQVKDELTLEPTK